VKAFWLLLDSPTATTQSSVPEMVWAVGSGSLTILTIMTYPVALVPVLTIPLKEPLLNLARESANPL